MARRGRPAALRDAKREARIARQYEDHVSSVAAKLRTVALEAGLPDRPAKVWRDRAVIALRRYYPDRATQAVQR